MSEIRVECFAEGSYGCNCYAVFCGEEIALVDIGEATPEIIDFARQNKEDLIWKRICRKLCRRQRY